MPCARASKGTGPRKPPQREGALAGPGRVGVVVQLRVPAFGRYLGHRVRTRQDPRPVGGEVGRAGVGAGHSDDGDVERVGRRGRRLGPRRREVLGPAFQQGGGTLGDLRVERGDGRGPGAEHGGLSQHEQPLGVLLLRVHRLQGGPVGRPPQALAGDPQPPQVEPFQLLPHLARLGAAPGEPQPGRFEALGVRGGRAAGGMSGRGVQQHGVRALHGRPLEAGQYRARRHGLLGEQVGGAHQYPDPRAPLGQRGCGRHRHGGGAPVVDPAREQHVQIFGFGARQQPFDLFLPQGERGARPYVSAALQPLEDEPACTLGEIPLQQPR